MEKILNYTQFLNENTGMVLPPIPKGYVRLTHVTMNQYVNSILKNGFRYNNVIYNTVDEFYDNQHIIEFCKEFELPNSIRRRKGHGDVCILIDMNDKTEYRPLSNFKAEILDKTIPKEKIVGYVKDNMFFKNKNYNPYIKLDLHIQQKIGTSIFQQTKVQEPQPVDINFSDDDW